MPEISGRQETRAPPFVIPVVKPWAVARYHDGQWRVWTGDREPGGRLNRVRFGSAEFSTSDIDVERLRAALEEAFPGHAVDVWQ
jgi:hypothetical protein